VTWFALTSFIIPLIALSFYYARICSKIRDNLRTKKLDKERTMKRAGNTLRLTQRLHIFGKMLSKDWVILLGDARNLRYPTRNQLSGKG